MSVMRCDFCEFSGCVDANGYGENIGQQWACDSCVADKFHCTTCGEIMEEEGILTQAGVSGLENLCPTCLADNGD